MKESIELAYITGIAIGDGNISNPNGRAYRLRITCDIKYPKIIEEIEINLKKVFPKNKISKIKKGNNAIDISVYNNEINNLFGWKLEKGKKIEQKIIIPRWINKSTKYLKRFIKGLIETDGSIYKDRKYLNVNLVSYNKEVIEFVFKKIKKLEFEPKKYKTLEKGKNKYTLRITKNTKSFINFFDINKT